MQSVGREIPQLERSARELFKGNSYPTIVGAVTLLLGTAPNDGRSRRALLDVQTIADPNQRPVSVLRDIPAQGPDSFQQNNLRLGFIHRPIHRGGKGFALDVSSRV